MALPQSSIAVHFAALPDPRDKRTPAHRLSDLLTIAVCASVCGANDWVAVATFGCAQEAWLRTFLELPHGIPSHDTFGRVFARIDPDAFRQCFLAWVQAMAPDTVGQVVAIDGKTSRRSHDRRRGQAALHLVSAWATASRLVLGQLATEAKSNEITAIPALLKLLDLKGSIVTIDAMGCQTAIAGDLIRQEADYVLALKQNQPTLYTLVEQAFEDVAAGEWTPAEQQCVKRVEKDHGRLEFRVCTTLSDPHLLACLDPKGAWAGLRTVAQVQAQQRCGHRVTHETRYYLSSLPCDATLVGNAVRAHWGIENRLHWVLDVSFREDESRVRVGHGAANLAVLRQVALNLLCQEGAGRGSVNTKRFRAALNPAYRQTVLAGLAAARTAPESAST